MSVCICNKKLNIYEGCYLSDRNLTIAAEHPARTLIKRMLMRRGDVEGVADGRALTIVEALLDTNMLKEDGDFLQYDHNRGVVKIKP